MIYKLNFIVLGWAIMYGKPSCIKGLEFIQYVSDDCTKYSKPKSEKVLNLLIKRLGSYLFTKSLLKRSEGMYGGYRQWLWRMAIVVQRSATKKFFQDKIQDMASPSYLVRDVNKLLSCHFMRFFVDFIIIMITNLFISLMFSETIAIVFTEFFGRVMTQHWTTNLYL